MRVQAHSHKKTTIKQKNDRMKTTLRSIAVVLLLSVTTCAGDLVNVSGARKIAVGGYDTVAFFTDSKPVNGLTRHHIGVSERDLLLRHRRSQGAVRRRGCQELAHSREEPREVILKIEAPRFVVEATDRILLPSDSNIIYCFPNQSRNELSL